MRTDPTQARNLRGQRDAALRLLDAETQRVFSCDCAEHVLWIVAEALPGEPRAQQALEALREYLAGRTSIDELEATRSAVFDLRFEMQQRTPPSPAVEEALWAVVQVIHFCAAEALQDRGYLMRGVGRVKAEWVPDFAGRAVALHAAGPDGNAEGHARRAEARACGRAASDREVEWQIDRLLAA